MLTRQDLLQHPHNTPCPICSRPLGDVLVDERHLVPRSFKGKEKIRIHRMCHQKIHATFTERELAQWYYTVQRIVEHEEMQKFINWVRKKPIDYYDKNDETRHRHQKRKR